MKISVITATYNAMEHLPDLVASLRDQVDKDFEWVVADGASTDGTLEYLDSIDGLNLKIISEEDFGIYDALNKAIKISDCEYYIVVGSDDYFYPDAISIYKGIIQENNNLDLVTCPVKYANSVISPKGKWPWFYGQFSYISMHSIGLLIKKSLHDRFGYYSRKYPIAADQYFILRALRKGAVIRSGKDIVGVHGTDGVSGVDYLGVITEFYRVQVSVGFNKFVQTALCCFRLIKNIATR